MKKTRSKRCKKSSSDDDFVYDDNDKTSFAVGSANYEEIKSIIPPPPVIDDPTTMKFITQRNEQMLRIRLKQIEQYIKENPDILTNFSVKQIYIAYELSDYNKEEMKVNLLMQDFVNRVNQEISARKSERKNALQQSSIKLSGTQILEVENKQGWSEVDIRYFMTLVGNSHENDIDWPHILEYFPNQSEKSCKTLYAALLEKNYIKAKKKKKKNSMQFDVVNKHNIHKITSLTFIKGEYTFSVGKIMSQYDKNSMLNPMPGFIDPITCKPMCVPAISPDGYVMDYNTWIKVIQEKKCNPFTRNPISSKRSLTILTIDNFELYKSKIVNWDETKPENYEERNE